jgi:hypothetical protein
MATVLICVCYGGGVRTWAGGFVIWGGFGCLFELFLLQSCVSHPISHHLSACMFILFIPCRRVWVQTSCCDFECLVFDRNKYLMMMMMMIVGGVSVGACKDVSGPPGRCVAVLSTWLLLLLLLLLLLRLLLLLLLLLLLWLLLLLLLLLLGPACAVCITASQPAVRPFASAPRSRFADLATYPPPHPPRQLPLPACVAVCAVACIRYLCSLAARSLCPPLPRY